MELGLQQNDLHGPNAAVLDEQFLPVARRQERSKVVLELQYIYLLAIVLDVRPDVRLLVKRQVTGNFNLKET